MLVQTPKNTDALHAILEIQLKILKLPTFLKQYASLAKEAAKEGHGYAHYLNVLSAAELVHREENRARKRLELAHFPFAKTLNEFQFSEIPSLNAKHILSLSDAHFVQSKTNLCFLGQTGTGKTHLAIALGTEACKKGYSVAFFTGAHLINALIEAKSQLKLSRLQKKLSKIDLFIVDELGYLPFSKEGAELLFQFFADRYQKAATIITSNLEFAQWTQFMIDPTMTAALLDRLTHNALIFTLNAESFRFKQSKNLKKGVLV